MIDLQTLLDVMMPEDATLKMPSAWNVGIKHYIEQQGAEGLFQKFSEVVAELAVKHHGVEFHLLSVQEKLQTIERCKLIDIRLFTQIVTYLFQGYYSAAPVLQRIGAGSVPAFPKGNMLAQDDWTILEPVYERGFIHRECP
jgi:hypothetical protein